MGLISRIGRKYAIYLPRKIVEELDISEGDRIIISVEDDRIVIRPVRRFFRRKSYWSRTSVEEIEDEAEEITKRAEKD